MRHKSKEDLRIVFLGTPEFAVESLKRIVEGGYNVVGVVTMPDKPAGRGHKMYQSPVKEYAVSHGLRLMQPVRLKDEAFVEELRSLNADLFVVIAFRMLPEVVWTMPPLGTFNLHASLLPRYRGAAPINWAVINGDKETGVTTFFLKHEIDTGDIIAQEKIEILPTDNVGDVHDKLMMLGADLTIKTIDDIIAGTLSPIPQDKLIGDTEPTPAPKIFKETCKIDWTAPADRIHNLIRGLSPYPAAWSTLIDGDAELGAVKIFESRIVTPPTTLGPGEVIIEGPTMTVGCSDGNALEILSLQAPGKRRMPTPDFLRGSRLTAPRFIS
ncbi:MAG: methionyl-tRNA formyltransferase [Bacteroides sp.]|nr:methionyl-tRNA formyltransferase [Bacteroides sp.]